MNDAELGHQTLNSALAPEIMPSEYCLSNLSSRTVPERRQESYHALPIASHVRRRADHRPDATQRVPHTSDATPYLRSPAVTSGHMAPCSSEPKMERDYKAQDWAFPVRFAPQ